jgi:hypothetical protein
MKQGRDQMAYIKKGVDLPTNGYAEVMETVFQAWVDMPFSACFEIKMWR